MTSSPEQNERAKMAGSTSNGRLTKFSAMTNGAEASEQTRGNAFPITNGTNPSVQNNAFATSILQNTGIWGNGSWNKNRPTLGSSRDTGDKFTTTPSGSGALAASSEAEPPYQPSWPSQTRNTSGNTSPNRPRIDPPSHEMQINSSFYQAPHSQPAIGQRASGRTNAGPALDNPQGTFNKFGQLPENPEAGRSFPARRLDGGEPRRNDFAAPSQLSRDGQFPQMSSRSSQGAVMSANHPEHDVGNSFIDAQYPGYASNHSQRQSFSGQSSSFLVQNRGLTNGAGQHMEEAELQNQMHGLTLDVANGNGLQGYGSTQSSFQFNPGSQPWETPQGLGQAYFQDGYANGINGVHDRRGSGVGRASPAGSAYRSPRSFSGTPQPGPDVWGSRPASRDHRIPFDSDRRGLMQPYQQPAQYPSASYLNTNYPQYGGFDSFQQVPQRVGYQGFHTHNMTARSSREHDPIAQASSPLLQEFRVTQKIMKEKGEKKGWELKEIYGYVVEFSGDQHGSRFIQQKLETANSDEKDQVFSEICPNAVALMKDVFGNYVIQKLFEHGSQVQKKILADKMKGQVVNLSVQMYACRVVQKALDHVLVQQQAELSKELEPEIIKVLKDQNGNHVVQKIIEVVPRDAIGFIMDSFKGRVAELAQHAYACRVVQRVLEYGNEDDQKAVLAEIHAHTQSLVNDQFGNYVAQHVIEHGPPEDRSKIIAHITSQLLIHSKHKFASNVVEKCIQYGTAEERRRISDQVYQPGGDDTNLQGMMKDQYGNYVVQKLLRTLEGHELETLKQAVKPQVLALKKPGVNPGKHVGVLESLVISQSSTAPGSPAPASPGLQGNGGSTVPTPNLTTEPNSPSSNPPSTNASSVGEAEHQANGKLTGSHINGTVTLTEVRDDDFC